MAGMPSSSRPPSIDLVVFDLDGVLADLDRERRLALLSEMTGKDPAFLHQAIWASDFERSAEAGAFPTGPEYLAELNRRIGGRLAREQWIRARREAMTLRGEVLRIAERLRPASAIAMLTNNGSLLHEALPEIAPEVHRLFGAHAHASFQFGARKPEREVFERLLARHAVAPERSLFIDDDEEYVAGARRAGMRALRYAGPLELARRLAEHGLPAADRGAGHGGPQ